jgi:hypothetical protein
VVPLNEIAFPYFPWVVQAVPETVPVSPFPDASATVAPVPSLNEYDATRPGRVPTVVKLNVVEYALVPPLFVAFTRQKYFVFVAKLLTACEVDVTPL